MSTRGWIFLFAGLVLVCALLLWAAPRGDGSHIAAVYSDGQLIRLVDLSDESASCTFTVAAKDGGSNTVCVQNGSIFVQSATCADKFCVHQGALSPTGAPIVCLPNRLVIRWQASSAGADAISGG